MKFDQKAKDTILWSAIYNGIAVAIEALITSIAFSMLAPLGVRLGGFLNIGSIIGGLISGAIGGAIVGLIIAMWYDKIMDINRKWFKNWFNTLFKLLFYPYLIGAILSALVSVGFAFILGIAPLVALAGTVLTRWFYAKMLAKKIGHYYSSTGAAK
jgi:hypothetical protein